MIINGREIKSLGDLTDLLEEKEISVVDKDGRRQRIMLVDESCYVLPVLKEL